MTIPMFVYTVLAVAGSLAACASARAEAPVLRRLELDLGAVLQAGFGDVCARPASDVVNCTQLELSAGPLLGARYRLGEHLALGGFVGLTFASGADSRSVLFRPALQLRVLPFGSRAGGLWVGPDVGLVHSWDRIDGDESGRSSDTAAAFGLSAGAGVEVTQRLALWLALRGAAEAYGTLSHLAPYTLNRSPMALVSLALGLSYLP